MVEVFELTVVLPSLHTSSAADPIQQATGSYRRLGVPQQLDRRSDSKQGKMKTCLGFNQGLSMLEVLSAILGLSGRCLGRKKKVDKGRAKELNWTRLTRRCFGSNGLVALSWLVQAFGTIPRRGANYVPSNDLRRGLAARIRVVRKRKRSKLRRAHGMASADRGKNHLLGKHTFRELVSNHCVRFSLARC